MVNKNELYALKESVINVRLELEQLEFVVKNLSDEERKVYDELVIW